MEILSVTLKNFKSHSDREFVFQPGTNAICGENGAGKTSILEAIAWVLFNYRGAYKNEDLIRNGAASAQVRVSFVSNRDQRTYEVSRCTRTGYTIFDPQLAEKLEYTRIEDEVLPWLRQQFGLSPGTDLAELFANTVGVPQGLFTADFLKPEKERKKTFDTILKVEEYRKTFEGLLPLTRYADAQVKELEQAIARYDEELEILEELQQKRQKQHQEVVQVQAELQRVEIQLAHLQKQQEQLQAQALQVQELTRQTDLLTAKIQTQTENRDRLQTTLHQAEQAVAICTARREAFQTFQQAETCLQELEQRQRQELQLQTEKRQQEKALVDRRTRLATLTHELTRLQSHQREIEQLAPLLQTQSQLEQEQQGLNQQLQAVVTLHQTLKSQEKQVAQTQTRLTQLDKEIERVRALEPVVQQIPDLEQRQHRYQQQLSRIAAASQFEADLRQLLEQAETSGDRYLERVRQVETTLQGLQAAVPLWAETLDLALTTLKQGTDWQTGLLTALDEIVADLAEQTSAPRLEQQLQQVQADLKTARQHQLQFLNLQRLLDDRQQVQQQLAELETSLVTLQTQLQNEPHLRQQLAIAVSNLEQLGDPRGRTRLLQQELLTQPALETQADGLRASLGGAEATIAQLEAQLATYADLPDQKQTQQALREQHRQAYEEYLAYRELANTRRERAQQVQEANQELEALQQQLQATTQERDRLLLEFDPVNFQVVQAEYQQANQLQAGLSARLPELNKYLQDLEQQLARLQQVAEKRTQATIDLKQKQKLGRFIKFARETYKKAGPRITERYVQTISREADRLFRELLNRPNVALEWNRDYEIQVQEGANSRRFVNLSGGEQMCAALAVRLALLKVLADIDIAFFDEPTTNMDRPRREHLADAIANIKTFRQLFVISHDDTFEKVTENVIIVEREP